MSRKSEQLAKVERENRILRDTIARLVRLLECPNEIPRPMAHEKKFPRIRE